MRQLRDLQTENARLKKMYADLSLVHHALPSGLSYATISQPSTFNWYGIAEGLQASVFNPRFLYEVQYTELANLTLIKER